MAWEQIEKVSVGREARSPQWAQVPCVGIAKNSVTLNRVFCEKHGVAKGSRVAVFVDPERKRIGLKVVEGEKRATGFAVAFFTADKSKTGRMSVAKVTERFPIAHGHHYVAQSPDENGIIVVDLFNPVPEA